MNKYVKDRKYILESESFNQIKKISAFSVESKEGLTIVFDLKKRKDQEKEIELFQIIFDSNLWSQELTDDFLNCFEIRFFETEGNLNKKVPLAAELIPFKDGYIGILYRNSSVKMFLKEQIKAAESAKENDPLYNQDWFEEYMCLV